MATRARWVLLLAMGVLASGCLGSTPSQPKGPASATAVDAREGTGVIMGVVMDPEEVPIEGADVEAKPLTGANASGIQVVSGVDGEFRIAGLKAGPYALSAYKVGYEAPLPQIVNATDPALEQIRITMEELAGPKPYHFSIHSTIEDWYTLCLPGERDAKDCGGLLVPGNWSVRYSTRESKDGPLMTLIMEAQWQQTTPVCQIGLAHFVYSPEFENDPNAGAGDEVSKYNASNPFHWTSLPNVSSPTRLVIERGEGPGGMFAPDRTERNGGRPINPDGLWAFHSWWARQGVLDQDVDCSVHQPFEVWVTAFHVDPAPAGWSAFTE